MPLLFYPNLEDAEKGTLEQRIEVLMDAAEKYKAIVLDEASKEKRMVNVPKEQLASYNWEEIAKVLKIVREIQEANRTEKARKSMLLGKLAEVYEVLRAAKMSKLEAVRIALISESNNLKS